MLVTSSLSSYYELAIMEYHAKGCVKLIG